MTFLHHVRWRQVGRATAPRRGGGTRRTRRLHLEELEPPVVPRSFSRSGLGSDANAGSAAAPWATLAHAVPLLHAGDTLYLRAGTYAQSIDATAFAVPSGTSWSSPVTIAAYPGEAVTLRPSSGPYVIFLTGAVSYVVFNGLTLHGSGGISQPGFYLDGSPAGAPTHVRLQNSEVKNCPANGVIFGSTAGYPLANYNQLIDVSSHNNGNTNVPPYDHGFY